MPHDSKVAVRMLAKDPFVTLVAVVSLALGIGANIAVFSLFEEVVIRTLGGVSAASALLGTVTLVTSYPPARRANRVDPVEALRWEFV